MTDKILKITDGATLLILALTVTLSLFLPSFLHPDLFILYESLIITAGFIFIMSSKLLKEENLISTPLDTWLFLLFCFYILSFFFASNKFISLNAIVVFCIFLLLYYLIYNYSRLYSAHFLYFIFGLAALLALYGLYQYFIGFNDTLNLISSHPMEHFEDIKFRLESKRVFSSFIYPNAFAGFLILIIPVAIAFFKNEKKFRVSFGLFLALLVANLFLTKSIGAVISLFLAYFIVLFFISDPEIKTFKKIVLYSALFFLAVLAAVLYFRGISSIIPDLRGRIADYILMLGIIKKHLFFGWGPGSFEEAYNSMLAPPASYLKYAHNVVLQIAVESGITGLALFTAAVVYFYKTILENFYFLREPGKKVLVISLVAAMTAFLIHNLIDFDVYNFEITVVFVVLLAVLISQVKIGLIETKKIKLTYMLGINPGKRREMILWIVCAILALSAVTGGKQVYVLSLINILVVAGFALWSVSKENIRRTEVDVSLLLFVLWLVLSLYFTIYLYQGLVYLNLVVCGVTVFYLCSQFLTKHVYKIIFSNFIVSIGVILSAVAAGQFIYRHFAGGNMPIDAFFPNANLFAGYMVFPFAFILSKILFEKKLARLWLKTSGAVLFMLANAFTGSRGGMFAFFIVLISISLYYRSKSAQSKDTLFAARVKAGITAGLLMLMLVFSFTKLLPSGEKITNVSENPFYFNRLLIYRSALEMIRDRPFTGFGIGSFERIFPSYNFPVKSLYRYQMTTPFAHNELLQIGATTGIIGFVLAVIIIFSLLSRPPVYEGHKKLWSAAVGAYFAVIGVLFHSLFDFNLHDPGIFFTLAVVSAMVVKEKYFIRTVSRELLLFTRISYFPPLILAFLFFTIMIRPGISAWLFSQYEKSGNYADLYNAHLAEPSNDKYLLEISRYCAKANNSKAAIFYLERAMRYDSHNNVYSLEMARIYTRLHMYEKAAPYYEDAVKYGPYNAVIRDEAAGFYFTRLGDADKAQKYLEQAIYLEPYYFQAKNDLAVLFTVRKYYNAALAQYNDLESSMASVTPATPAEKSFMSYSMGTLCFNKAGLLKEMGNYSESCYYYGRYFDLTNDKNVLAEMKSVCAMEKK